MAQALLDLRSNTSHTIMNMDADSGDASGDEDGDASDEDEGNNAYDDYGVN